MSLGKTLAELRKKSKMTQSELGDKLNISAQAISKWENDSSEPDISTLKKLADIYGVTIADIVDGENHSSENSEFFTEGEATGEEFEENLPSTFDVYLTEIDPANKIQVIRYFMNMLGIQLAEAKAAVDNLPYLIVWNEDREVCDKISAYLSEVGARVSIEPCRPYSLVEPKRVIASLTTPAKDFVRPIEKNYNMRKKFVKANVKAGIIGIALMVILIILSSSFIHVLLSIYAGIATYTLIFLNGYPTLTRKLLTPNREIISTDEDERTSLIIGIIKLIIFVILIPWFLIVWLISPINYIFSIKTRVVRMKNYDNRDAIYIEEKYPL